MQVIAMVFCLLAAGFWIHAWFKSDGCLEQLFNLWFAVMFSPIGWPEVDKLEALRLGFRVNLAQAANTYERTIRAFHRAKPTPKRLAHAQRLTWQREQLIRYGRFDPTDLTWRQ